MCNSVPNLTARSPRSARASVLWSLLLEARTGLRGNTESEDR